MNIVGEGFPKEVIGQINQRQKVIGSLNRTNEQLSFLNSKTGWVRMASSVDVTQVGIRGLQYTGDELAKNFVLFGGVTSTITGPRAGVWPGTGTPDDYAYGLGGTEFGLKPIPGITQAAIKTETRGSLKTSTINIIAHNKQQFDIIDLLYMRLGYSILLEWGNSSFFYNNGVYEPNNPFGILNDFLNGTLNYDTYLEVINKKRLASNGNYDAIVGKVVNFNWTYTKEKTYDITIILRSMGDVIESLKSNILLPGGTSSPSPISGSSSPKPTADEVIKAFANAHEIGKEFYRAQQFLSTRNSNGGVATITTTSSESSGYDDDTTSVTYYKQVYEGEGGTQYFVKLAHFLHLLQTKIIPNVDNDRIKLLKINNRVKSNIIYYQNRQVSANPGICNFKTSFGGKKYVFMPGADDFQIPGSGGYKFKGNFYGYIMNTYFNLTFILNQLEALKDDKGKVSIYDLLVSLCKGWNEATGHVNSLEPTVNVETNEVIIVDQTSLPDRDAILKNLNLSTDTALFEVYKNNGFVRDINFNTTISNNLATIITVGATANGYVLGADATALSRMNNNLVDRFKKEITSPETTTDENSKASETSLEDQYADALKSFNVFLQNLSNGTGTSKPKWNQEAITAFTNTQIQLLEYNQAKSTQTAQNANSTSQNKSNISSPNIGFLPFDLQLTMDGLSGMKVYQKYTIDTDFLPSNYPKSLEFIVKGITNTISNNTWTTTLESFTIPKDPFGLSTVGGTVETASKPLPNTNASSPVQYFQSNVPESKAALRARLTRILDDGTQTLGILEVYDPSGKNVLYRLTTVELPWKDNKNGESCIATGTYLINSRANSKYGKHFWLVGSQTGNWNRIPGTNPSDRSWVLIHTAPKAPGWLAGCIGPGPSFDFKRKNSLGNPDGIGTAYLEPARTQSTAALNKLVSTLYSSGGFKMIIENLGGVSSASLPKKITDPKIKGLATDIKFKDLFKGI